MYAVRRVASGVRAPQPGSTLTPIERFAAVQDDVEDASVVLGTAEIFEREPDEYALARLEWRTGCLDAARAVVQEAAASEPPGVNLWFPISAVAGADAERRSLATTCGFELFREKAGYRWVDAGRPVPPSADLTFRSLTEVGRIEFATLIARCLVGTLDRTDATVIARQRPETWAHRFLERHAEPADKGSWLLGALADGTPVGFVGVAGRPDESREAVLVLIGVLPEHRGRRWVDALVRAGQHAARARGFASVLSLVDVANHPMTAAMRRTGHDVTSWHSWLYVRTQR